MDFRSPISEAVHRHVFLPQRCSLWTSSRHQPSDAARKAICVRQVAENELLSLAPIRLPGHYTFCQSHPSETAPEGRPTPAEVSTLARIYDGTPGIEHPVVEDRMGPSGSTSQLATVVSNCRWFWHGEHLLHEQRSGEEYASLAGAVQVQALGTPKNPSHSTCP
jgi:hypothetical protein